MVRISFVSILLSIALSPFALQAQTNSSAPAGAPVLKSAYGERLKVAGLPNGGKINNVLFRGAQPQLQGLQSLQKLGVTTVVDLRGDDPVRQGWERKAVESLGMRFVSIPVSGWDPPSNEQVAQFLSLFHGDEKEKVYVHCRYGEDRTGVFVAAYRMTYDGWPAKQALNEMYFFGFNGFWHPSMKSYIRDFPARLKSAPALVALRPATQPTATN
jgi:tyrosine-protein phosphatase SIW14